MSILMIKVFPTQKDRNLLLNSAEAERGKLLALRGERIKLWEERYQLQQEMTSLSQQQWLTARGAPSSLVSSPQGRPVGLPAEVLFVSWGQQLSCFGQTTRS